MKCIDIDFGTYICSDVLYPPWSNKSVNVDKCLSQEILQLWKLGIRTTGCCCGHGKAEPMINVSADYIVKMKELGYIVQFNPCRPNDEDTFRPKTKVILK